jgi:hypothetical protein
MTEWEGKQAAVEEEQRRLRQELQRWHAQHAAAERQLAELHDEVERRARVLMEDEPEAPAPAQQAACTASRF